MEEGDDATKAATTGLKHAEDFKAGPAYQQAPSNMSVIICSAIMGCRKMLFQVNVFVSVWGVVSLIIAYG